MMGHENLHLQQLHSWISTSNVSFSKMNFYVAKLEFLFYRKDPFSRIGREDVVSVPDADCTPIQTHP